MTKTEKITYGAIFIVAVIALSLVGVLKFSSPRIAGDSVSPLYLKTMTSTSVAVGATSTTVLAPSGGRVYAIFGNASSTTVYLTLGVGATTTSGIVLPSGTSYVIDSTNQYVGLVTAINPLGTSTVTVTYSQ